MIDVVRVLTYCKNLDVQIEDFLLLNVLRTRKLNPDDDKLKSLSGWYYEHFQFIEDGNAILQVDWKRRVEILISKNLIVAYPNWYRLRPDNEMVVDIDLRKLEVTDKFNENLFTNDVDDWWDELLKIYQPHTLTTNVNGKRESVDEVKNRFWAIARYGDKAQLMKILAVTEYYIKNHETHRSALSNYLSDYPHHEKQYLLSLKKSQTTDTFDNQL